MNLNNLKKEIAIPLIQDALTEARIVLKKAQGFATRAKEGANNFKCITEL